MMDMVVELTGTAITLSGIDGAAMIMIHVQSS